MTRRRDRGDRGGGPSSWLVALMLALVTLVTGGAGRAEPPLGLALISSRPKAEAEAAWAPAMALLSHRLGREVRVHWYPDYAGTIWSLRNGHDQLAFLGNKSAIEAVDKAGAEVFAIQVDETGRAYYHSVLVVRDDSPFADVESALDAASGLTLGLGDPNSTSGTVVPMQYLFLERGIDPYTRFSRVVAAGHPANIEAVLAGRIDLAAVSGRILDYIAARHPHKVARLRVLWRSPAIPGNPMLWRSDLPQPLKQAIRAFFLDLGRDRAGKGADQLAAERTAIKDLDCSGFSGADNRHLNPVRRLDLMVSRSRIAADFSLGAERDRLLADLDRRLAALGPREDFPIPTDSRSDQ